MNCVGLLLSEPVFGLSSTEEATGAILLSNKNIVINNPLNFFILRVAGWAFNYTLVQSGDYFM